VYQTAEVHVPRSVIRMTVVYHTVEEKFTGSNVE
jgi:hypothetical protein